jgi:hypothetical protein
MSLIRREHTRAIGPPADEWYESPPGIALGHW